MSISLVHGAPNVARQIPVALDRDSAIPLYQQLYDQLAGAIRDGAAEPGERFETEMSLASRLGLSRLTVRRTLSEMVNRGMLVRGRGVGTVVADHRARALQNRGPADGVASDAQVSITKLLHLAYPVFAASKAQQMGLGTKTPLLYLERLRLTDGDPIAILRNWLPPSGACVRAADLESRGLYEVLRTYGVTPDSVRDLVGSRVATSSESRLLDVDAGAPVLTLTRTAVDAVGRPVELGEHTFRADRFAFRVQARVDSRVEPLADDTSS